jgi:hypothetical protein
MNCVMNSSYRNESNVLPNQLGQQQTIPEIVPQYHHRYPLNHQVFFLYFTGMKWIEQNEKS